MQIVRELTLQELISTAITMLLGKAGKDFAYYQNDEKWWAFRLSTRINDGKNDRIGRI